MHLLNVQIFQLRINSVTVSYIYIYITVSISEPFGFQWKGNQFRRATLRNENPIREDHFGCRQITEWRAVFQLEHFPNFLRKVGIWTFWQGCQNHCGQSQPQLILGKPNRGFFLGRFQIRGAFQSFATMQIQVMCLQVLRCFDTNLNDEYHQEGLVLPFLILIHEFDFSVDGIWGNHTFSTYILLLGGLCDGWALQPFFCIHCSLHSC